MNGEWLRRPEFGVTVVFVHGVLSSGKTCWLNPNGTYWPTLVLDDEKSRGVGVYVFSYRTDFFCRNYHLGDAVDALKEFMRLDDVLKCRTLVFVAHSMGGLVVRKFLVERTADLQDADVSVGLFLVASPSLGSGYANLLAPLARFLGHSQADALRFSQSNTWLMDLDKQFTNLKENRAIQLFGKELIEDKFVTLPAFIGTQVVQPFSGARYFGEPFKIPDSDHFSIAKPSSKDAIQHRQLMRFITDRPVSKSDKLPIEPELLQQLLCRRAECEMAHVPFRTYHKLASLFEIPDSYAEVCFNTLGVQTARDVKQWLHELTGSKSPGSHSPIASPRAIDDDPVYLRAFDYAWAERAEQIDERHYLLAILADTNSGTVEELTRALTLQGMLDVQAKVKSGRPVRTPGKSRVRQLITKKLGA